VAADNLTAPQAERLLTPHELSELLALGRTSTYNLISSGEIPSVKIGRLRRVRHADVEHFIAARLEHASSE
jgi:excisionase family DNA binding protein